MPRSSAKHTWQVGLENLEAAYEAAKSAQAEQFLAEFGHLSFEPIDPIYAMVDVLGAELVEYLADLGT